MRAEPRNPGQPEFGFGGQRHRFFHVAMAAIVAVVVIAVVTIILIPGGNASGGRAGPEGPQSTYMIEVPGVEGHSPVVCVAYNGNGIDCDWGTP